MHENTFLFERSFSPLISVLSHYTYTEFLQIIIKIQNSIQSYQRLFTRNSYIKLIDIIENIKLDFSMI